MTIILAYNDHNLDQNYDRIFHNWGKSIQNFTKIFHNFGSNLGALSR